MGHLCSDRTVRRHHVGLESHGFGWGREMPGEVRKPAIGPTRGRQRDRLAQP